MMVRSFIARAVFVLAFFALPAAAYAAGAPATFQTAQDAKAHCPKDTVVWLNLPTGVYHFQGQRYYGNTKSGAYVCEKEAVAAGDRATRNGQ